jgi:hypothetical protein
VGRTKAVVINSHRARRNNQLPNKILHRTSQRDSIRLMTISRFDSLARTQLV